MALIERTSVVINSTESINQKFINRSLLRLYTNDSQIDSDLRSEIAVVSSIISGGGVSNEKWNSAYSTVNSNSAIWTNTYTELQSVSTILNNQIVSNAVDIDWLSGQVDVNTLSISTLSGDLSSISGIFWVRDERASSVNTDTPTLDSFNIRTINAIMLNTITGASLAANQITLPAGKFKVKIFGGAYRLEGNKLYFYNVTDAQYEIPGLNNYNPWSGTGGTEALNATPAFLVGVVDIASPKIFEVRHLAKDLTTPSASPDPRFGFPTSNGDEEVYLDIQITPISLG